MTTDCKAPAAREVPSAIAIATAATHLEKTRNAYRVAAVEFSTALAKRDAALDELTSARAVFGDLSRAAMDA